mgnify:CR=1 FL=1
MLQLPSPLLVQPTTLGNLNNNQYDPNSVSNQYGAGSPYRSNGVGWKGRYRIEGPAFIYVDHDTGQLSTILGYPTHLLK